MAHLLLIVGSQMITNYFVINYTSFVISVNCKISLPEKYENDAAHFCLQFGNKWSFFGGIYIYIYIYRLVTLI